MNFSYVLTALMLVLQAIAFLPIATAAPAPASRPQQSPTTITFNPPRRGAPPATIGLGSRGDCLSSDRGTLMVLVPAASLTQENGESGLLGLTTDAHPTLLVHVPDYQASAQAISLRLMQVNADEEVEFYTQNFALPDRAGIVHLRPSDSAPPLAVGQQYHWYVSIVCNSIDQSGNAIVDGWVERMAPNVELAGQLSQAEPLARAALYAQAGIWHDTVTTLSEMYLDDPEDSSVQATWQNLLDSVGLETIAEAPLLECCQPRD